MRYSISTLLIISTTIALHKSLTQCRKNIPFVITILVTAFFSLLSLSFLHHNVSVQAQVDTSVNVFYNFVCGNGIQSAPEECDLTDLAGETCVSLGYDSGTLTCNANCTFNTSQCVVEEQEEEEEEEEQEEPEVEGESDDENTCGNGVVEGTEDCDGTDLDDQSCRTLGFSQGNLACYDNCTFNKSLCYFTTPSPETAYVITDLDEDGIPDQWEEQYDCMDTDTDDSNDDDDNDQLTCSQEYELDINPCNEDTDFDGMPDGWEVVNELNPKVDDSQENPDYDHYTNLQEYQAGSNPLEADVNVNLPETGEVEKPRANVLEPTIPISILLLLITIPIIIIFMLQKPESLAGLTSLFSKDTPKAAAKKKDSKEEKNADKKKSS